MRVGQAGQQSAAAAVDTGCPCMFLEETVVADGDDAAVVTEHDDIEFRDTVVGRRVAVDIVNCRRRQGDRLERHEGEGKQDSGQVHGHSLTRIAEHHKIPSASS